MTLKIQSLPVSRHLLQGFVMLGALVPVLAGLSGIIWGPGMFSDHSENFPVSVDSHYRYLSGLLMGIGFGFLSCVPRIETKKQRFVILASIVVIGGIGRLYSLISVGAPNGGMLFGLGMELIVTPLLALWQMRVAKQALSRTLPKG